MKLLTYKTETSEPRLGFIHNKQVIDMEDFGDVSNFPLPNDMLELIDMGFDIISEINDLIEDTTDKQLAQISYAMEDITLLAPIPYPRKNIIGIGLNYTEHVAESARTLDTANSLPQTEN
jgi:2-keto-4-pentenoate hydratase/2-oxohepta-3-ene-1,7-dioic acid hydratase in catechol pathway